MKAPWRVIVEIAWRLTLVLVVVLVLNALPRAPGFARLPLTPRSFPLRVPPSNTAIMLLAAFWIVGGALVRALVLNRSLLRLLVLRTLSLAAGTVAVAVCYQMVVTTARSGWPMHRSVGLVSLFSLAVYGSWRWISLLLAVVEDAGNWGAGWRAFVRSGSDLAMTAATNSTLKWFFLAVAALPAVWLWQRGMWGAATIWSPLLVGVSGYFAAKLKESIHELTTHTAA